MSMRRTDLAAVALSAFLHGLLGLATWDSNLFKPADAASAEPQRESVEVSLAPETETAPTAAAPGGAGAAAMELPKPPDRPDEQMPNAYTDVPERMRGEKPDRADFLALVNSRAADLVPGGERGSRPAAPEESEVDQVAIRRQQDEGAAQAALPSSGGPANATPQDPVAPADAGASAPARGLDHPSGDDALFATGQPEPGRAGDPSAGHGGDRQGDRPAPPRTDPQGLEPGAPVRGDDAALDGLFGGEGLTLFRRSRSGGAGDPGFDFDQPPTGRPGGNAFIYGDYALNTYAWNFAPWLQKFGQDLRRNWNAPYAYMIGVISGKTEMKVVIERDGRLSSLEVRSEEGHESLRHASESAVRAAAPYSPLPTDFPEPKLEIILTLYYPAWKTEEPAGSAPPATGQSGRGPRGRR